MLTINLKLLVILTTMLVGLWTPPSVSVPFNTSAWMLLEWANHRRS